MNCLNHYPALVSTAALALVLAGCDTGQPVLSGAGSMPEPSAQRSAGGGSLPAKIDAAAREVLSAGTVPSVSVAVVQDGRIVHLQAYGRARLNPQQPAKPSLCYSIGSVSKQFVAAAMLLLAEEGKVSLDDPVSRFLPQLTRASEVTIRELLSHTSGYEDYWPQDYVMLTMLEPVSPMDILKQWAGKPLNFEPGTEWQYSNTGYVIAGVIVEKVSGRPLFDFLDERIFRPLGMRSVRDCDAQGLGKSDPAGYMSYGLGPWRQAPATGKGWLFAACGLAMTAEDLAKWDISMMNGTLLKPESWQVMESATRLKNGRPTGYGLGLSVRQSPSGARLSHGGEVSGFVSRNVVLPKAKIAIVALSNGEGDAVAPICRKITDLLLPTEESRPGRSPTGGGRTEENRVEEGKAQRILEGLRLGHIDRTLLSPNANAYFSDQALKDFAAGFKTLGEPLSCTQTDHEERGGMTYRGFEVIFQGKTLQISQRTLPDGKIEQYQVSLKI